MWRGAGAEGEEDCEAEDAGGEAAEHGRLLARRGDDGRYGTTAPIKGNPHRHACGRRGIIGAASAVCGVVW